MAASLGWNRYGKSRVRVLKVFRDGAKHSVRELTVKIGLEGDFDAAHTKADNTGVLPTDTMKNTVYALAKDHPMSSIEAFALHLGRHFVSTSKHIAEAHIDISQVQWERMEVGGVAHDHSFQRVGPETATCAAVVGREGARITSGIDDWMILKTTQSGFSDFMRDKFTTLKDADDRLFGTSVTATWALGTDADFNDARCAIRKALLETFAKHDSLSVQHTLFAMGEAALGACASIDAIDLAMPNNHNLLVDLSPFGMPNDNEIFLPIDEPHGMIEATVRR